MVAYPEQLRQLEALPGWAWGEDGDGMLLFGVQAEPLTTAQVYPRDGHWFAAVERVERIGEVRVERIIRTRGDSAVDAVRVAVAHLGDEVTARKVEHGLRMVADFRVRVRGVRLERRLEDLEVIVYLPASELQRVAAVAGRRQLSGSLRVAGVTWRERSGPTWRVVERLQDDDRLVQHRAAHGLRLAAR